MTRTGVVVGCRVPPAGSPPNLQQDLLGDLLRLGRIPDRSAGAIELGPARANRVSRGIRASGLAIGSGRRRGEIPRAEPEYL
jgi:hypothetical protein